MLGFAQTGQVGVDDGSHRAPMAEVDLDLAEVLALLQQVSGVAVPQGVDVRVLGDAAGLKGQAEGALESGAAHGPGGRGSADMAVTFGGKKQGGMTMGFPLLAQELQRALGQRHVAVLVALAGPDVQEQALRIDVAHLEPQAFAQAQAARVDRGQTNAMIQCLDCGQDAAHLAGREDDRQFELRVGASQIHFGRPGAAQRLFPEDLESANGLGAGLAGDLLVLFEMDAILTELLSRDQLWGFVIMLAELANAGVVSLFGARADGQKLQVIGEGFQDGVRGTFFICIGLRMLLLIAEPARLLACGRQVSKKQSRKQIPLRQNLRSPLASRSHRRAAASFNFYCSQRAGRVLLAFGGHGRRVAERQRWPRSIVVVV